MKTIRQEYAIAASLSQVWQALVNPKVINDWGGGPAKMSDEEGFKFSLWGGDIHGTNTKVVKEKLLEQDWFDSSKWDKPSKVKFRLQKAGKNTALQLVHSEIPDASANDIDQGWRDFYLGPLKDLLEN